MRTAQPAATAVQSTAQESKIVTMETVRLGASRYLDRTVIQRSVTAA